MTDRELLELAAKAAGVEIEFLPAATKNKGSSLKKFEVTAWSGPFVAGTGGEDPWDPLSDDGDALRLAVKLRMSIHYETQRFDRQDVEIVEVHHSHDADLGSCQCVAMAAGEDAGAATRRAITRAAAEIGRGYRD
ncbi:hypothetical protein [Kerstersia similis]|uniref:hypothetical protein n=1 Tax=Kerstersia similis TaxID=206505 RepID=UPI0039EE051B